MKNKLFAMILISGFCLSLASCGSSNNGETSSAELVSEASNSATTDASPKVSSMKTQYPLTLDVYNVDGELVTQTYNEAPTKVIPYTASAVQTMLALGLEDKIVGIMAPDNEPPAEMADQYASLNVIGDKTTVSKEAIIALDPDLIFGRVMSLSDDTLGTVGSYNDMGINVYTQKASSFAIDQSLDNIFEDVRNIGKIFDVQEEAESYISTLETRLSTVKEQINVNNTEEPLKVILMVRYDNGNFSAFGSNSALQNEALREINMTNGVGGTAGQMTDENLVALNPDAIIYVTADRNADLDKVARASIMENVTLSDVTAVKNNKYVEIPYETLMDYGPSTFNAIELIYEGIYAQS